MSAQSDPIKRRTLYFSTNLVLKIRMNLIFNIGLYRLNGKFRFQFGGSFQGFRVDHSVQLYWLEITRKSHIFVTQKFLKHLSKLIIIQNCCGCCCKDNNRTVAVLNTFGLNKMSFFLKIDVELFMSWFHRDVADRPAQDDLVVIVQVVLHGYDVLIVVGAVTSSVQV